LKHLLFLVPTAILKGLVDTEFLECSDSVLEIRLNKKNEKVTWFKNDVELKIGADQRFDETEYIYFLNLPSCSLEDAGRYSIKVGDLQSKCNVVIKGEFLVLFFFSLIVLKLKFFFLN
jgi:hypothetical protein